MDYQAALDYLKGLEKLGIRFRIENTQGLLSALGFNYSKDVVHIAGTNGKGSCAATLAKILQEDGRKVGLYTSPELIEFTERIIIDGRQIPNDRFAAITEKLKPIIDSMPEPPTFFEATTALALKFFADEKVDVMVLEAGMGGRLDSTNAIPSKLSIITNIDLDHTKYLGDTVEAIAKEKAGIIAEGGLLITAADDGGLQVLYNECKAKGAKIIRVGYDVLAAWAATSLDGTSFRLRTKTRTYVLKSRMRGIYQADNTACAVLAAEHLGVTEESIISGVSKAYWPGRLDVMQKDPTVIIDCAHNPAGLTKSMEFIKSIPREKLIVVAGFSKDKDYKPMIDMLKVADSFIAVEYANPRSLKTAEILANIKGESALSVQNGVKAALAKAGPKDLIFIVGSIFVAGEAVQLWKKEITL